MDQCLREGQQGRRRRRGDPEILHLHEQQDGQQRNPVHHQWEKTHVAERKACDKESAGNNRRTRLRCRLRQRVRRAAGRNIALNLAEIYPSTMRNAVSERPVHRAFMREIGTSLTSQR